MTLDRKQKQNMKKYDGCAVLLVWFNFSTLQDIGFLLGLGHYYYDEVACMTKVVSCNFRGSIYLSLG